MFRRSTKQSGSDVTGRHQQPVDSGVAERRKQLELIAWNSGYCGGSMDIFWNYTIYRLSFGVRYNTIHQINQYPLDSAIDFPNTCPLDSDLLSNFWTTGACFIGQRSKKPYPVQQSTSWFHKWNEGVPPAIIYANFFLSIAAGFSRS